MIYSFDDPRAQQARDCPSKHIADVVGANVNTGDADEDGGRAEHGSPARGMMKEKGRRYGDRGRSVIRRERWVVTAFDQQSGYARIVGSHPMNEQKDELIDA